MAAMDRIGRPGDIADVVAFLVSGDARRVTGHLLDATAARSPDPASRRPDGILAAWGTTMASRSPAGG
jgi:NAD(P)-dependent dehydrogenase (short-subunit alcohol dehydrogenase family)